MSGPNSEVAQLSEFKFTCYSNNNKTTTTTTKQQQLSTCF